ncbi:MAG: hypothetical protein ACI9QQ_002363, partial [Myxococcota bacterium]
GLDQDVTAATYDLFLPFAFFGSLFLVLVAHCHPFPSRAFNAAREVNFFESKADATSRESDVRSLGLVTSSIAEPLHNSASD